MALVPACVGRDPRTGHEPVNAAFELPRITANADFYVVSYSDVPAVDAAGWRLVIDGLVSSSASIGLDAVRALPLRDKEHTLQCIGASPRNRAIGNALWRGLPLVELLAHLGVERDAGARFVQIESADGFLNQIPVSDLEDREVWLVVDMNGEPLPAEHGFPARLLVSDRYGFKNPKWITRLTFAADEIVGTWQELGYPDDGSNRPAAFVEHPTPAAVLEDAPFFLVGSAYCGGVGIDTVELSRDNGVTWEPVELTFAGAPDVWTLWRYGFTPAARGDHVFLLRVTTVDGRASLPENPEDNGGWQGYGRVSFTIA